MAQDGFINVTPLVGNDLHFHAMSGEEEMSRPFQYVVDVLTKNPDIKLVDALGEKMTVSVQQADSNVRHFNGHVTRFSQVGMRGTFFQYQVVLHPWLWFLAHSSDCRIFQNKTVPAIVKKIFGKYQSSAFKEVLEKPGEDYPAREYTVQYRETDLRFVSRLLEEAGISYHFVHDADSHTLVLTDSVAGREHQDGYATVPLRPLSDVGEIECFTSWHVAQEVRTAGYVLRDFDYLNPRAPLLAQLVPGEDKSRKLLGEFYDYPGRYQIQDAGDRAVKVRLNEAQSTYETITGGGPVRGLGVGNIFMLVEAPWSDGKTEHLVVRARYELQGHSPESGGGDGHDQFDCAMTMIDSQIPFRPAIRTPKPIVQGPQTAIVVGPKKDDDNAEEIWTDDLGRVLVRFHWERVGADKPNDPERADDDKDNESTPCWVRVASLWAGKQWGIQFTPRIGQEVMVEFLEGDPDRPVVTGRMYNNLNKPPYPNAKKTQSGIKSHSTKGGGPNNFNEIRFDDKKGAEEMFIQAEKTQTVSVKGSRSLSVGGSESISVGGTRDTTVTHKDTVKLHGEHSTTVDKTASYFFKGGHIQNVYGADQEMFVEMGRTDYVTKLLSMESGDTIKLTVGGSVITITTDSIDLTAAKVTINGSASVEVVGGVIKLNS
ncbi:MAG TPA: type VI secretion system tip protein TssI/VgrG [Polyangia bacterium]|jgi:type VI secretion system secreted protein VgrG